MKKGILDGYKTYDSSGGYGNARKWREAFRQRMSKDDAREILGAQSHPAHVILGISADATADQIKKAYRAKVMEWHPDRNQHRIEEAERMTININAAYETLT